MFLSMIIPNSDMTHKKVVAIIVARGNQAHKFGNF